MSDAIFWWPNLTDWQSQSLRKEQLHDMFTMTQTCSPWVWMIMTSPLCSYNLFGKQFHPCAWLRPGDFWVSMSQGPWGSIGHTNFEVISNCPLKLISFRGIFICITETTPFITDLYSCFTVFAHILTILIICSSNLHLIVFTRSGCLNRNF